MTFKADKYGRVFVHRLEDLRPALRRCNKAVAAIWLRPIPADVQELAVHLSHTKLWLDSNDLPTRQAFHRALLKHTPKTLKSAANWLVADQYALAEMVQGRCNVQLSTGQENQRVHKFACGWHWDRNYEVALCTYAGPTTQYMVRKDYKIVDHEITPKQTAQFHHLPAGAISLHRGTTNPLRWHGALAHRGVPDMPRLLGIVAVHAEEPYS